MTNRPGWIEATSEVPPMPSSPTENPDGVQRWPVPLVNGGTAFQKADTYDEAVFLVNQRSIDKFGADPGTAPIHRINQKDSAYYRIPLHGVDAPDYMVPKDGVTKQERLKYVSYAERMGAQPPREIEVPLPFSSVAPRSITYTDEGEIPPSTARVKPETISRAAETTLGTGAYIVGTVGGSAVAAPTGPAAPFIGVGTGALAETGVQELIMPKINAALGLPEDDRSFGNKYKTNLLFGVPDLLIPTSGNVLRGGIRSAVRVGVGNDKLVANSARLAPYDVTPYASVARGDNASIFRVAEDFLYNTFTGRGPISQRSHQNMTNFIKHFEEEVTKTAQILDVQDVGESLLTSTKGVRDFGAKVRRGGGYDNIVNAQIKKRNDILDQLPGRTTATIDRAKDVSSGFDIRNLFGNPKDIEFDSLISTFNYAVRTGHPMRVDDALDLKRYISDFLDDPVGLEKITTRQQQKISEFSKALDDDILDGMRQYDAVNDTTIAKDFAQIRKEMSERQTLHDQHLRTIFKQSPAKAYGQVYSALRAGDADKIKTVMQFADDETRQLVAQKTLQSLGYKNGAFDLKKFNTQWKSLSDKGAAKEALFGYDENLIRQLDELQGHLDMIIESTRFFDRSGGILSRSVAPVATIGTTAAAGAGLGYSFGGQDPGSIGQNAVIGAVLGLAAPRHIAKILSSPNYVGALNDSFRPGKTSLALSAFLKAGDVAERSEDLGLKAAHMELLSIFDSLVNSDGQAGPELAASHGGE